MKKQIMLYLNLDNKDERLIFNYLKNKNKNAVIKRTLLNEIKGIGFDVDDIASDTLDVDDLDGIITE